MSCGDGSWNRGAGVDGRGARGGEDGVAEAAYGRGPGGVLGGGAGVGCEAWIVRGECAADAPACGCATGAAATGAPAGGCASDRPAGGCDGVTSVPVLGGMGVPNDAVDANDDERGAAVATGVPVGVAAAATGEREARAGSAEVVATGVEIAAVTANGEGDGRAEPVAIA